MELAVVLLLLTLIVAAIGWVVFGVINKIDRATTPPQQAGESRLKK